MKVAVPTRDGLQIATDFSQADSFLVVTIQAEEVTGEELRKNSMHTFLEKGKGPLALIGDCSAVVVNKVDRFFYELIRKNHMECIETGEILITNALLHYLENEYRKESDTCCSP